MPVVRWFIFTRDGKYEYSFRGYAQIFQLVIYYEIFVAGSLLPWMVIMNTPILVRNAG